MQPINQDISESLRRDVGEIWDQNADFWDERMGEGNDFHKRLIEPAQLRLLNLRGNETVLDAACGNGQFARKLADSGARVVAFDVSAKMIEKARSRSADYQGRIEYRVIDGTDREQLSSLGEKRFDRVVCTMALMDIADIGPLISASARLLKTDGHFVFSLLHPCFNSGLSKFGLERYDAESGLVDEYFVRVCRYSERMTTRGIAMRGQPVSHYYFHRPLSALFGAFFAEGFVLDGIEEPVFEGADVANLFEKVYETIPPALVARMRRVTPADG